VKFTTALVVSGVGLLILVNLHVIANQNGSSGNNQAVELSIKLRDAARVAKLVHGLERDGEIEGGVNPSRSIDFFEIRPDENRPVLKLCQATAAKVQHLRREVDQRVARDLAIFQQCFGEKSGPHPSSKSTLR
jgi:hypothetical protein